MILAEAGVLPKVGEAWDHKADGKRNAKEK